MRLILSSLSAGLVLAGCATSAPTPAPPPEVSDLSPAAASSNEQPTHESQQDKEPQSPLLPSAFFADGGEAFIAWRCTPAQDLISASPENRLRLWSAQGHYELQRAVVASGARYVKGDLSFWNKGDEAFVESDNGRLECEQDVRRESLTRDDYPDAIFHAQGNEPGWTLSLDRQARQLTLVTDYGERTLQALPYRVTGLSNGEQASMTLSSTQAAQPLKILLEARACFDDMSGQPYPVRVTVQLGDQRLRGCGQGIEAL
ncbi:Membrane-bound lysozyme-inhibitor of c-type lysozyme [Modicisalibacter muralis]|uniref:Membrane-bound lysozyme-inhibitor of c-type lysozyme n=1 Tax=Modicisalibacter muralis TaxID=119000 RepID=A0A1G9IKD2_9GAMM|nr:MliC family protein [Halomonas muralis]SDL25505.1 Membrane-bound lysozyme-inhibitor of c-type lysozyme [Halomonas muralis]